MILPQLLKGLCHVVVQGVAPRVGAPLAKMTRVWRVDTCSDGVEADLLGVQQLLQVFRMYSLAISV